MILTFLLDEAADALDYQKYIHPRGKVVDFTVYSRKYESIKANSKNIQLCRSKDMVQSEPILCIRYCNISKRYDEVETRLLNLREIKLPLFDPDGNEEYYLSVEFICTCFS